MLLREDKYMTIRKLKSWFGGHPLFTAANVVLIPSAIALVAAAQSIDAELKKPSIQEQLPFCLAGCSEDC